jgi:hypothetical protein
MRSALLGSPGVGTRYRLPFRVGGQSPEARLINAAPTYAAVVANHTLDVEVYVPGIGLVTESIVFAGTENTRALFIAAINAQAQHFKAVASGATLISFRTALLGSLAAATVLAPPASDADVLASLGLVGGTAFDPAFGVRVLGQPHYGKNAVQYFGGKKPSFGAPTTVHSANQHGVTVQAGIAPVLLIVDRNQPRTVSSDLVRFTPQPVPGAG